MTDNIEPAEEQRAWAAEFFYVTEPGRADDLAIHLAEREHKLRMELSEAWRQDAVDLDAARARIAELEGELRIAWADCHDGSCEACPKCVDQAKHQRDFATARVAELEAEVASKDEERTHQVRAVQSLRNQTEAAHLAHIKALWALVLGGHRRH